MKKAYPELAPLWISVEGVSQDGRVPETLEVRISRTLLETWFRDALGRIVDILDQLTDDETTMLLFTGGLLRSQYLVDNLKAIYRERGIHVPISGTQQSNASDTSVVKGALARFIVRPVQADPTLCLGIIEKSRYKPELHAGITPHEVTAAEAGISSDRIAKLDGELYALDRFRTILAPDAFVGSRNLDETLGLWQEFLVTTKQPTLETVVYETRTGNSDNAAIFDSDRNLRDDIRVFRKVERTIDEATMKQYQYRLPFGKTGARHYRVVARLRATGTWPDVSLELVLAPAKSVRKAEYDALELSEMAEDDMMQLGTDELHNGLFPSTMQRNRHGVSPAGQPPTPITPRIQTSQELPLQEPTPALTSATSSPLFVPEDYDDPLASRRASDRVLEQFEVDGEPDTPKPDSATHGYPTPEIDAQQPNDRTKKRRRRVDEPDTTNYEAHARPGNLPKVTPQRNGLPRVKTLVPKNTRKDVYDGP